VVVVVFIGFVLVQRGNAEQATRPSTKDEPRQKPEGLRRMRKKPLRRSYDLEAKSRKTKRRPGSSPSDLPDFTAATSVARGQ
jgi:hypothetical protein